MDKYTSKCADGTYETEFSDEMRGGLKQLKAWIDALVEQHGSISDDAQEYGQAAYRFVRPATADEITDYDRRQAERAAQLEAFERAEFKRLSAKFKAS